MFEGVCHGREAAPKLIFKSIEKGRGTYIVGEELAEPAEEGLVAALLTILRGAGGDLEGCHTL